MSPINWDARLEHVIDAHAEASKHSFVSTEEKDLFINSLISKRNSPYGSMEFNVVFDKLTPIVVEGRVQRGYIK